MNQLVDLRLQGFGFKAGSGVQGLAEHACASF